MSLHRYFKSSCVYVCVLMYAWKMLLKLKKSKDSTIKMAPSIATMKNGSESVLFGKNFAFKTH